MSAFRETTLVQKKKLTWMWAHMMTALVMSISIIGSSSVFAYKVDTHLEITSWAITKSNIDYRIKQLGFSHGIEHKIKTFNEKSIIEWVKYGSGWEDNIGVFRIHPFSEAGALYNHFYNPIFDMGYYEMENDTQVEKGESLVHRMNNYIRNENDFMVRNEWSYQTARELYWVALTGDGERFRSWRIRDNDDWFCSSAEGKKEMTHEERNQFVAWTFQALGHLIHLIQDASVPAHTRNDIHAIASVAWALSGINIEPYEEWAIKNWEYPDLMNYKGAGSEPWAHWNGYNIPAWNAFIDTENGTISQRESLDQGLAEYSYANFFSDDSMSSFDLPSDDGAVFSETQTVGGSEHTFRYLESANFSNGGVKHLALCGIIERTPVTFLTYLTYRKTVFTVNNEKVHQDYASKLIPRAVGYSAGFLNYFFRGSFSVSQAFPERNDEGEITGLDLKAKNASKVDESSEEIEPFGAGNIVLSCKYIPPGEKELVYNLVEDVYTIDNAGDAINSEYVSITANFANPIPPGAKDLSFTLVFRGELGQETNAVAARAFKFTSRIAYSFQPDGSGTASDIYTILPDGTDERKITNAVDDAASGHYFNPRWSPDGRLLAFDREICNRGPDGFCTEEYERRILVTDRLSQEVYPGNVVSTLNFWDPAHFEFPEEYFPTLFSFSPDNSRIVALATNGIFSFLVVSRITDESWEYINGFDYWTDKRLSGSAPAWSPRGDEIAYYKHREGPIWETTGDIFLMRAEGGEAVQLTSDGNINTQPAWSADGEQMVFVSDSDGGNIWDIWIMDRTGENKRKILDCDSNCYSPSFSPEGQEIAFEKDGDIYIVNINGQGLHRVTSGKGKGSPCWSPMIFEASTP